MKTLSKTDFLRYIQCHKYVWLAKYRKDLLPEVNPAQQAIFDQGYEVEGYAQQLFDGGVEIEGNFEEGRKNTKSMIESGHEVLFQATAFKRPYLARADILKFNQETKKWDIYEVKSSTSAKDEHYPDLAFQKYAFEQDGIPVGKCYLVRVNNEYVREGTIDPTQLLAIDDLTELVGRLDEFLDEEIPKALKWIEEKQEPQCDIGKHCNKPYECPFKGYCWKDVPKDSIFDISRLSEQKLKDLLDQNVLHIKDVPEGFPLSEKQRLHVNAIKTGKNKVDDGKIRAALNGLEFPLYFLDYETHAAAVPLFDGIKPYQQVCFQYSLHVLEEDGDTMIHREYLETSSGNPIPGLLKKLEEDIGEHGSVIVWNKSFEMARNKEMAALYPEYETFLTGVNNRVFDLMDLFKDGHFVHPDFRGSYSIKNVLPVLAPDFSHKTLAIQDGGTASLSWHKMVHKDMTDPQKEAVEKALLEYCKLDTLAMVLIYNKLKEEIGS